MRKEADDRRLLFQPVFQFGNRRERFGVGVIEIEDDKRWLVFIVAREPVEGLFFSFREFDLDSQLARRQGRIRERDRKSTRLNSSHLGISYAVFCLKKKTKTIYK